VSCGGRRTGPVGGDGSGGSSGSYTPVNCTVPSVSVDRSSSLKLVIGKLQATHKARQPFRSFAKNRAPLMFILPPPFIEFTSTTIVFEIIKGFARNVEENHFKAWFISLIKNITQNKITYLKNDGFQTCSIYYIVD